MGDFPAVLEANGAGWPCSRTRTQSRSWSTTRCATSASDLAPGAGGGQAGAGRERVEYEEGDYGVAWSVYLPDPDGYLVEITTYEPAPA